MRVFESYVFLFSLIVSVIFLLQNNVHCQNSTSRQDEIPAYPTRYDSIDVDIILSNDRIMRRYIDCILSRGPCTREGLELRKIIPDAIRTECAKCNPSQKKHVGKVLSYLFHNRKNYWDELLAKFDPDKKLREKYGFT